MCRREAQVDFTKPCDYRTYESGISDHHLIFCTRKIQKSKSNNHNYVRFRNFENYTIEKFENSLRQQEFPNYSKFDNVDDAYSRVIPYQNRWS